MGRHKALVIHDDLKIVDELTEILTSLRHEHQWARSQQEAWMLLEANAYSYILLDLEIPLRPKGGKPSTVNGSNLLDEILAPDFPPVIVLLAFHSKHAVPREDELAFALGLVRKGAADVIRKPVKGGPRVLDKAIKNVLARRRAQLAAEPRPLPSATAQPRAFAGGEMIFYPDRVELDGVVVLTDQGTGLMRKILRVLKDKQDGHLHDALSVQKLAARTDPDGDVAKAILQFRDTVTREMAKERNVHCGRMAVIESGRHGYRFTKGITARLIADEAPHEAREAPAVPGREAPHGALNEPPLNERQKWLVAEHQAGRKPSNRDIQKANRCSRATAARDLQTLRSLGLLKRQGR